MATSCLDNTESEGILDLRKAHAELLRAEASYQTALAAYTDAQTALEMAKVEGENIANELARLDIEEKKLKLRQDSIMVEYWEKYYELELAKKEADNEYYIAELEMDLLELERRQIDLELYLLQQQQEKESLILKHQANLLQLKQQLAQAQAAYDQALRDIAAANHGLTEGEQEKLDSYIGVIEGSATHPVGLKQKLRDAEDELILAQQNLIDVKYDYDSLSIDIQLTRKVEAANKNLKNAEDNLANVTNLDLSGLDAILAEGDKIEKRIDELERQQDDLDIKAAEKEKEKEEFELVMDGLLKRSDEVNTLIYEKQSEYTGLWTPFETEEEQRSLEIPSELEVVVRNAWYLTKSAMVTASEDVQYIDDFWYNPETGQTYLPSGKLSWVTTKDVNYRMFVETLRENIQSNVLSAPEISDLALDYERSLLNKEIYTKRYEDSLASFKQTLETYNKLLDEYGYIKGTGTYYTNKGKLGLAIAALETLPTLDVAVPEDEAAITKALTAIKEEQAAIKLINGRNTLDPDVITFANYQSGTITDADLANALNSSINAITTNDPYQYQRPANPMIAPDTYFSSTVPSVVKRWNDISQALYNANFVPEPLTLEALGYGELWYAAHKIGFNSWVIYYTPDYSEEYLNKHMAEYYGHTSFLDMLNGAGLFFVSSKYDNYSLYLKAVLDGQNMLKTVVDNLGAMFSELNTLYAQINSSAVGIKEEMLALSQELSDITNDIRENDKEIRRIDTEIESINGLVAYSEKSVIQRQIDYERGVLTVLEGIMSGKSFTFTDISGQSWSYDGGKTITENAETLAKLQEEWIEANTREIEQKQEDLRLAQVDLDRFREKEDSNAWAIEEAELALKRAQEDYNTLLEQFNYYNKLLQDYLSRIIGANK